jgi:hypothetical protein
MECRDLMFVLLYHHLLSNIGLANSLNNMRRAFPLRIWVVDNSGSMVENDGHRIIQSGNSEQEVVKMAACTRWDEIRDCVNYHINLAGLLDAPTRFRVRVN